MESRRQKRLIRIGTVLSGWRFKPTDNPAMRSRLRNRTDEYVLGNIKKAGNCGLS